MKQLLSPQAPSQPKTDEPCVLLFNPPCVQFLQTAGHCSSCLLFSPQLGLIAHHARSKPDWLSGQHWSRCQPQNAGCCFLQKDNKRVSGDLSLPAAIETF